MKPGNILVNLNDTKNLKSILSTTCKLASKYDAHLIGAYIIPAIQIYPLHEGIAMAEIIEGQNQRCKAMADDVRQQFDRALSEYGISGEWHESRALRPNIADEFIEQARTVDLVVISQVDRNEDCEVEQEFAERTIMESGRPVLLLPRLNSFECIGENVLIGWNRSQESARAGFDALALMSETSEANFVWIDPQKDGRSLGKTPCAPIAKTFAHHNINVTTQTLPSTSDNAGEILLQCSMEQGADLLVMGAYGHSRMREFVFGGATRHVLNHMTLPVLMSH